MDTTVKISEQTWSKLQALSKSISIGVDDVVEEALQEYLRKSQAGSLSNGQPQQALNRPQATYKPQTHLRQIPVVPSEAAVLFIDVQNYNCHKDGAEMLGLPPVGTSHLWTCLRPVLQWSVNSILTSALLIHLIEGPFHTPCLGWGDGLSRLLHSIAYLSVPDCTGHSGGLLVEEVGGD